ncbi:hypothetical protein G9A89_004101 [Geosiphon pyriformis]|nr:hypothetical protein G9A89_004101 [Geosiphon pyriformis]
MAKKDKKGKKKGIEDSWQEPTEKEDSTPTSHVFEAPEPTKKEDLNPISHVIEAPETPLYQLADIPSIVEDDEFGGLMAQISKVSAKDKKSKKKKNIVTDDDYADSTISQGNESIEAPASGAANPQLAQADDWAEESGPKSTKDTKRGKKVKDKSEKTNILDKTELGSVVAKKTETEKKIDLPDEGGEIRILSKKEKEKLKKQKEKEKKKAEADKKKVQTGTSKQLELLKEEDKIENQVVVETTGLDEEEEEDDEDDKAKNKKKKKKKKTVEEEKKPKKKGPNVAAMKAVIEAQRAAEEELRIREEEEKRRIEEEQRKAEEEERRKEEAKRLKKEKEKAKKDQLRKEGKLLSKAQKTKQQQAQLRLQQMIDSGLKIEGLVEKEVEAKPKRVVYGNKKKKGPKQPEEDEIFSAEAASNKKVEDGQENVLDDVKRTEADKESWEDEASKVSFDEHKPIQIKKVLTETVKENWEESEDDIRDNWDDASGDEKSKDMKRIGSKDTSTNQKKVSDQKLSPLKSRLKKTEQPAKPEVKKVETSTKPTIKKGEKIDKKTDSRQKSETDSEESETETSEEDSEDDSDDIEDEEISGTKKQALKRKQEAAERRRKRHEEALAARSKDNLRSPICCILGHVDTGKTKLLDKIRQTNVQEGEAGGITQQIGATYFPMDTIKIKTAPLNKDGNQEYKLPGLLVIDTPGHESFTNLRSRGSSLCNIAILVVDIMHGLEPQTLESLRLLRDRKAPFIVALNKIDRMYDWKPIPDNSFQDSLSNQSVNVKREFKDRVEKTIIAFAEQGLNSCLYYENKNFAKNVSLVPTSAITGEGIPDMLMLLVNLSQSRMSNQLMYLSELECTVLEVKVIEGLGTTIDVILSNGVLNEGDKIILCGLNGPISTTIRALLTPQPLRELRVKSAYVHHKTVKAALGIKISAQDLDKAIAGSRLLVVGPDDDEDDLKDEVMSDLKSLFSAIDKSGKGVCVQASTLGSLEALLEFLKTSKIPVSGINIGPVHKKDIMRAASMLEKAKELAVVLCFDVKVDKEAQELADEFGIKIFKADIIYHLFDQFTAYNKDILEQKRKDQAPQAIFPCILKIIPGAIFNKRDPILIGVDIVEGILRPGTPICVLKTDAVTNAREVISLGKVTSMHQNHKSIEVLKKGQGGGGVAIKIECPVYEHPKLFGRHFTESDELYSKITRASIDVCKESFRNDLSKEDWHLMLRLKSLLGSIDRRHPKRNAHGRFLNQHFF